MANQKSTKATLLKLFVLDEDGTYVGEFSVDEECPVGFDDFVRAIGNMAMEDLQTVFLGEVRATMLHGIKLSLIAISKGALDSQELTWAKATLTTVETILGSNRTNGETLAQAKPPEQLKDPAFEEGMNRLKEEEARIREEASKLEEEKKKLEQGMRSLQGREADLWVKTEKMQEQALKAETEPRKDVLSLEEIQAKEEKIRELESDAKIASEREAHLRKELDSVRAELDSAKRDIETRVKILHKKALELLEREEELRKKSAQSQVVVT